MANNFRDIPGVTIVNYVAKNGNDSNDGLTKDTPKVTLPSSGATQIGAGYYLAPANYANGFIYADGIVILDFNGNAIDSNAFQEWVGFEIRNINGVVNTSAVQPTTETSKCVFKNCDITLALTVSTTRNREFRECVFLDSNMLQNNIGRLSFFSCIFINGTFGCNNFAAARVNQFFNSYVDPDAQIILYDKDDIKNCNVQGTLFIPGLLFGDATSRTYAIQDELTGTPQDNGYAVGINWISESQLTTDGYTGTIVGWDTQISACINKNPNFNNSSLNDYSLQSNSPHIGAADDGSNIGGTNVRNSILVTDGGVGDIEIIPSAEIDTSLISSYRLDTGQVEGSVRFITKLGNTAREVKAINILAALAFNSDFVGNTTENNNVPDSEPETVDYPDKYTTNATGGNTTTLKVADTTGITAGLFVRVLGEDREISSVPNSTDVIVSAAFMAEVGSGVEFQVGTELQLAVLRPNRLTFKFRCSTQSTKPTLDSHWDNDINPIYGMAGEYLVIENGTQPKYYIDLDDSVYGGGDGRLPSGLTENTFSAIWIDVMVVLRNNYGS